MESKKPGGTLANWIDATIVAVVAAIAYFPSVADYAFPGEGARLMTLWAGLDAVPIAPHPVMRLFAGFFGGGNLLAPVCGTVSAVCMYLIVSFFVRERIDGESVAAHSAFAGRLAGLSAALLFVFAPAVRESATRLSSSSFDAAWAFVSFALMIGYARAPKKAGPLFPVLIGAASGFGLVDSPLFILLAPGYILGVWAVSGKRGGKPYGAAAGFLAVAVATFCCCMFLGDADLTGVFRSHWRELRGWLSLDGWMFIVFFAVLPFAMALFSSHKAFNMRSDISQWLYHIAMSVVSILAVATPLSPSALMAPYGELPVAACACAAATAGYLLAYWFLLSVAKVRMNESVDKPPVALKGRPIALVALPVLALTYASTVMLALISFDGERGRFADQAASKLLDDLGDRTWFVTDGVLDDHLRLEAARRGKELNLVCLQRDLDRDYLERLSGLVKEKNVGGDKNADLVLSLELGVLPFVQDWFAADPEIGKKVAIFGAPDLWYAAGIKAIPEFLFFGADPGRGADWGAWKEFDAVLSAPKGWGSYRLRDDCDPVDLMRLSLRRHLGLVANDRGVMLQDDGDDDGAFAMYELVLNEIDADNVCALFNEFEMARTGFAGAVAKKRELEKSLKQIVDDKDRRYVLWKLAAHYGYIRSPEIFVRLGFSWARSGRPGEALSQIRRAIDFVPTDKRATLFNMMAALYASDSESRKSREMYREILAKDADNHDALIGMMRLELMDGDGDKALEYLARAAGAAGDDSRGRMEKAMLHMMKNEFSAARGLLRKMIDDDPADVRAWSMYAATTMQMCDATADEAEKSKLARELEESVIPEMEKQSRSPVDYYVLTTKAFVLMRKGREKRDAGREEALSKAREALLAAAKERPDVQATQDLVLGLDISLNDTVQAESHAREVLRRNRKAPLANYVMGSLALQKGDYSDAEAYLRRAADASRPVSLAQNDLAEVYRRTKRYGEAERYARMAIRSDPALYVAYETLGAVLMDSGGDLDEAEELVGRACELSKGEGGREEDVRMLVSLARVQIAKGDATRGKMTLRKVQSRIKELSDFERREFEDLQKSVR